MSNPKTNDARPARPTQIYGTPCRTSLEAVQLARIAGGAAILLGRRNLVVSLGTAELLETTGVAFAHLFLLTHADGSRRVVTVPVNDR